MSLIIWIAEPIVIGFGLIAEDIISAVAAMQFEAILTGGGAQQSSTVMVIFLVTISGLVELLIFTPS